MTENKEPKYSFQEKEGEALLQPSKRQIAKMMEVTETFTYYDALAYCMKLEKAIADKEAEVEGLLIMRDAYRKELVLVDKALGITKADEEFHLELHQKCVSEEAKKQQEGEVVSPLAVESGEVK